MNDSIQLRLRIESAQRAQVPAPEFTFDPAGGTVGRDPSATWPLPDPKALLSGQHMRIIFSEGRFALVDISRNGVFINGSDTPLGQGAPYAVRDGDRIGISDYDIAVQLITASAMPAATLTGLGVIPAYADALLDTNQRSPFSADPLAQLAPAPAKPFAPSRLASMLRPNSTGPAGHADDDLADLFDGDADRSDDGDDPLQSYQSPPAAPAMPLPVLPPDMQVAPAPVMPSAAKPAAVQIPENWLTGGRAAAPLAPAPAAAPPVDPLTLLQQRNAARTRLPDAPIGHDPMPSATPPVPSSADNAALTAFWDALGIDPSNASEADRALFMAEIGRATRAMTEGLIKTMSLRASTKVEFNVEQTMIRPTENNPFKFSNNVDELLTLALTNRNRVFLPLSKAVQGAFNDIQSNEAATLAAVQLSLRSLIDRFQPQKLAQQVKEGKGSTQLFGSFKGRCWDFFTSIYSNLAADADEASNRIFEVEFGRAYRERMQKPSGS